MKNGARLLVVTGAVAWLALFVVVLAVGAYGWAWWTAVIVLLIAWVLARVTTRDIAEKRVDAVDEYEAAQRSRARGIGYRAALIGSILLFITLSVFAVQARAGNSGLLLKTPDLLFVFAITIASLPTFTLAWTTKSGND